MDLQGWFSYARLYDKLVEMLPGPFPHVAEIGVWKGRGVQYLCKKLIEKFDYSFKLYAIDNFEGVPSEVNYPETLELAKLGDKKLRDIFIDNINELGLSDDIWLVSCDSIVAADKFARGEIPAKDKQFWLDAVFIDANHDTEHVIADIEAWQGVAEHLCGHDVNQLSVYDALCKTLPGKFYMMPEINCWTTWKELADAVNAENVSVLLGIPAGANGEVSLKTTQGVINAAGCMHNVDVTISANSILPHHFNSFVVQALNNNIDRLVILHSDVAPRQADWLDKLLWLMDEHKFDVISAVVPIKDSGGLTSTGMDTDLWRPRRLTMHEIMELPPTFTGGCVLDELPLLLVNTGMIAIRMDKPWSQEICFDFSNRIVRLDNQYMAEVEPEDWKFSRWCNLHGLKIGATREIELTHAGHLHYANTGAWGRLKTDVINDPNIIKKLKREIVST